MDKRFTRGRWTRGRRVRDGVQFCLIAAVDDAAAGFQPEVKTRVMQELVRDLPKPLRRIGERVPRAALVFYNDYVGRRRGTLRLIKTTLARVSTMQPFTAQMAVADAGRPWPSAAGLTAAHTSLRVPDDAAAPEDTDAGYETS